MKFHFHYAVHQLPITDTPLSRFGNIADARKELENLDNKGVIVTEVSEQLNNGGLLIKERRIAEAPQIWIKSTFSPEFEDRYLCHLVVKEGCGNLTKRKEVIAFSYGKWVVSENIRVTHWMIVPDPNRTVVLCDDKNQQP